MDSTKLWEERAGLLKKAESIWKAANDGNRGLNTEERAEFDKLMEASKELEQRARDIERLATELKKQGEPNPRVGENHRGNPGTETPEELRTRLEMIAFRRFLKGGYHALNSDEARALQQDRRTMDPTDDTQGGYLKLPKKVSEKLVEALDKDTFLRSKVSTETFDGSDSLGVVTITDKSTTVYWGNERPQTITPATTPKFGAREFKPNAARMLAKINRNLMRRSRKNPEDLLLRILRNGYGMEDENQILNGSGNGKPLGVFVADANGVPTSRDIVSGSNTGLTYTGLLNFIMKGTRPGYKTSPSYGIVGHSDLIIQVLSIADSQSRPLFLPALGQGGVDTILGVPFWPSEFAPNTWTAGLYTAVIGDWSYYMWGEDVAFDVQILTETYALEDNVGYWCRRWCDGQPILAEAFGRLKSST